MSVVVPAFECSEHIRSCLTAVAAQTYQGALDVTVALAPSSEGTADELAAVAAELAESSPRLPIQVIGNPGVSAAAGLNAAIAASSGEVG